MEKNFSQIPHHYVDGRFLSANKELSHYWCMTIN